MHKNLFNSREDNILMKMSRYLFALLFVVSLTNCTNSDQDDFYVELDKDKVENNNNSSGDTYSIEGNYGPDLKTAWSRKLESTHVKLRYTPDVWNAYYTTDIREDGFIDDLYGGWTTNYIVGEDQQRTGTSSGKYDREHSFPKSWWNSSSRDGSNSWTYMYTDLYHVYPCDHDLNSMRSNYPFGEPTKVTKTSESGCKLGTMFIAGVGTTIVFEPFDDIKGDLARTYFYMATRYDQEDFGAWGKSGATTLTLTSYPFYKQWALDILLKWHEQDPVSERERKRNDEVYKIQKNRNPFVDYPELVDYLWGDKTSTPFYYSDTAAGVEIK